VSSRAESRDLNPTRTGNDVAARLLACLAADEATRERLAADGSLFDGYHPEMEAVHRANAVVLREIIATHGWPGRRLVGEAGAEAAWRIAQHAIGEPAFMRQALELVRAGVECDDLPAWQLAYLEDRVRSLEGRPQLYGTQHDWDEAGLMSPFPEVEDPAGVDARRAAVGLGPLAEATAGMRAGVAASNEHLPRDLAGRQREMDAWARRVGWR
jgi:hypothetical protein